MLLELLSDLSLHFQSVKIFIAQEKSAIIISGSMDIVGI